MTTMPGEVAGLPDGGPATLALLKAELKYPSPADPHPDDVRLQMYVDAVNDQVRTWPVAERSVDQDNWRGSTVLGAVRLAAALDNTRNPDRAAAGVEDTARTDPEISRLLELGDWQKPSAR